MMVGSEIGCFRCGVRARVVALIIGRGVVRWKRVTVAPHHFAIVMLGTPTRGTSLTVIWNKRYSIWKASRFQRANGPVVFTA